MQGVEKMELSRRFPNWAVRVGGRGGEGWEEKRKVEEVEGEGGGYGRK